MKLVPDWKEAWRWHSTQAMTLLMVIPPVWVSLPPDVKEGLPEEWVPWIMSVVAFAAVVGRLRQQPKK